MYCERINMLTASRIW